MTNLHGATLPPDWKAEDYGARPHLLEIKRVAPGSKWPGGYVTVNMRSRIFAGGVCIPLRHAGTSTYAGRGWKKKIIEDACEWLEREMGDALKEKP